MRGFVKRSTAAIELKFSTAMTPAQCREALQREIKPPVAWYKPDFPMRKDAFTGKAEENRFEILRVESIGETLDEDSHGYLPVTVTGDIAQEGAGAVVSVVMRASSSYSWRAKALSILGVMAMFGAFGSLLSAESSPLQFAWLFLSSLSLVVLPWVFSRYAPAGVFESEAARAQKFLCRIFATENVVRVPRQ